jgi:hypothetical protein
MSALAALAVFLIVAVVMSIVGGLIIYNRSSTPPTPPPSKVTYTSIATDKKCNTGQGKAVPNITSNDDCATSCTTDTSCLGYDWYEYKDPVSGNYTRWCEVYNSTTFKNPVVDTGSPGFTCYQKEAV